MIADTFDRRTIAKMEVALERACLLLPAGSEEHSIEDGNLPTAQISEAHLKAFEAVHRNDGGGAQPAGGHADRYQGARRPKNFSVLPPEIACGASNGQSLAFDLLRTVRLSLREIAKHGKRGRT